MAEGALALSELLQPKQKEAWAALDLPEPSQVLYGGAAGGGKSWLGAFFLIYVCYKFPGTRWLLGRARLNVLKETSYRAFRDLARNRFGWIEGQQYIYNANTHTVHLPETGSEILLKDLIHKPSDRDFDALGSLEITGAVLEEVAQISATAKNTVWSRIRYRLTDYCWECGAPTSKSRPRAFNEHGIAIEWTCHNCHAITRGIPPKMLMTCNPTKGWPYDEFYAPARDGHIEAPKHYVRALPNDNRFLPETYKEALDELDERSRRRLKEGDWEYDEVSGQLIHPDALEGFFAGEELGEGQGGMTVDVARFGSDRSVICVWRGAVLICVEVLEKKDTTAVAAAVRQLMQAHGIPVWRVAVDDDGVGGGVADQLPGCQRFVNNSAPFLVAGLKENYPNLKTQCQFIAAREINAGRWSCLTSIGKEHKQAIRDELATLILDDTVGTGKLRTLGKDEQKRMLNGRSPDYADAITMFAYLVQRAQEPSWVQNLDDDDDD